eukprot:scaffold10958_cov23-Cyclotella_meneghiniana.AAC.2
MSITHTACGLTTTKTIMKMNMTTLGIHDYSQSSNTMHMYYHPPSAILRIQVSSPRLKCNAMSVGLCT